MAALPNVYYRAKASFSISSKKEYPFYKLLFNSHASSFTLLHGRALDKIKMVRTTFVPGKILYPYLRLDFPFMMK